MTVIISVIAFSCNESSPDEPGNDSNSWSELKGNVFILNEDACQFVDSYENDSIIQFSNSTPRNLIPQNGSIIYVPESEKTPWGYLGRIIKVEKSNGYKVFTETVPLDDVFGALSVTGSLKSLNKIEDVLDAEGNKIEYEIVNSNSKEVDVPVSEKSRSGGFYLKDKLIKFPFKIYSEEADGKTISISGNAYVGFKNFNLSIDINNHSTSNIDLCLTPCVGLNAISKVKLTGGKKESTNILIGKVTVRANIPTPIGIPIIIPVSLYIYGTCGASGEITATLKFKPEYSTNWNFRFNGGQWFCNHKDSPTNNPWIASEFEVKGEIYCGAKLGILVGLYSASAGIGINVIPNYSIGCSASIKSENIMNINPLVDQTLKISSEAYCAANFWVKHPMKATFQFPDYIVWNEKVYLLPQYSDFTATGKANRGEISYKIDQHYFLKFLGIKHGLTIFDTDNLAVIETANPSANKTDDKGFSYFSHSTQGLKANHKYYATPTIFGLNVKLYGEKHYFTTEDIHIPLCPNSEHNHIIDLGLPSGTKWSCCNMGASAPEQFGNYYGWGENRAWAPFSYSYVNMAKPNAYSTNDKYVDIGSNISGTKYDVVHNKMGGGWKIPTSTQMYELEKYCKWEWTQLNGANGYLVTGPNGHHIFLPATGQKRDDGAILPKEGTFGSYWTGNGGSSAVATAFYITETQHSLTGNNRAMGLSIRPCLKE